MNLLWRTLYCLATWLALPVVLGFFTWRGRRERGYLRHWHERLGWIARRSGAPIWVHAASVGEIVLVTPLVDALRARYPRCPLLITTMTPSGREQARRRFGDDGVDYGFLPFDTLDATRRFFARVAPRVGVIAETELWPNLIAASERAQVPLALVNASLSTRSAARYRSVWLGAVMRFMLARIAVVAAATDRHAARFLALGSPPASVHVTGNLKYDVPDMDTHLARGRALRASWRAEARPVWVAASTHAGEERLLVEAFDVLLQTHGHALLVIAPRHAPRFDAAGAVLARSGYRVARRSRGDPVDERVDIVLADTVGEVPMFYAAADVVFVGGSFVTGIGGHNVIEAAALGRALCVGPYIEDWSEVIDALVEAGGAAVCDSPRRLAAVICDWLGDAAALAAAQRAAAQVASAHRGALQRTLTLIAPLIG